MMNEPSPLMIDKTLMMEITNNDTAEVIPEADMTVANIALTLVSLYLIFLIALISDQTQTPTHINKAAQRIKKYCHGIPLEIPTLNAAYRTYSMIIIRNGTSVIGSLFYEPSILFHYLLLITKDKLRKEQSCS